MVAIRVMGFRAEALKLLLCRIIWVAIRVNYYGIQGCGFTSLICPLSLKAERVSGCCGDYGAKAVKVYNIEKV